MTVELELTCLFSYAAADQQPEAGDEQRMLHGQHPQGQRFGGVTGRSLRTIIGEARQRAASSDRSVIRLSVETFMEQLRADDRLLHVLLREGTAGSDAFKHAVDRELNYFEDELRVDLIRLAAADGARLHGPAVPTPLPIWCPASA